ncbi:MAG: lysophospholipid acyltransferase family protein [Microbacteriaceae bacterium]
MASNERGLKWRLIAGIALPLMGLISSIRVRGEDNVPATGPFIVAPCHFSAIDPVVMGVGVWKAGRVPRFMAKASLFKLPILGSILTALGQIPVEREGTQRALGPMKAARVLAKNGNGVIIYPEGTLTRDPELWPMRGKTGAVRMALESNIPLIPAAHWGTADLMPRYSGKIRFFPRTPITVLFGKPIDLSAFAGKPLDLKVLNQATLILMNAITDLQAQLRGEKAPEKRWDPIEHNQTTTGKF